MMKSTTDEDFTVIISPPTTAARTHARVNHADVISSFCVARDCHDCEINTTINHSINQSINHSYSTDGDAIRARPKSITPVSPYSKSATCM